MQEYILGIDVLQGLTVNNTTGEFCLCIWVVTTIIWGCSHHALLVLPQDTRVVNTKQYYLLGGNEEIEHTILTGVIHPTHIPCNSPM